MNVFSSRFLASVMLYLSGCGLAGAQVFGLSVSNSPSSATVGGTLTYTINVTNLLSGGDVVVTNFFPSSVRFLSSSNTFPGTIVTNGPGQVVFDLGLAFAPGNFAILTVNVSPTNNTTVTNVVAVGFRGVTNVLTATNITAVSNALLSLTMNGPSAAVVAGDWMTYSVAVTNAGGAAASNVLLTNVLPAGVGLVSVAPSSLPFTFANGVVLQNLGNLPPGAGQAVQLTVEPTNAGALPFMASLSVNHAASATAVTNISVLPFDTSQLVAINASAMTYNPQNGLLEQTIKVTNNGATNVFGARVIISGLTNTLYNAVGTNNGNPFVTYNSTLAAGASVNLLLEYVVPTRTAITVPNSAYSSVPISASPFQIPSGTSFNITLVTNLPDGRVILEFQATPGRTYTVLYSDSPLLTNMMAAQPNIVAQADRVQWIDDGPPKTVSAPANASSRFYTILLNP